MENPFEAIGERLANIEALLVNLSQGQMKTNDSSPEDQFFTVGEAAGFLNLKKSSIYRLIAKGELPVMKRSKRCYFSKKELIHYLNEVRRKTSSEIELEAEAHINKKRKS